MSRFVLRPLADTDMQEIWDRCERYSERAAERVTLDIFLGFENLALFPKMGRERPELGHDGLRSHVVRDYVILYREVSTGVEVVRVLHGAADLSDIDL